MHALARLLQTLLNWDYNFSIFVSAVIVLVYILLGGLTSWRSTTKCFSFS